MHVLGGFEPRVMRSRCPGVGFRGGKPDRTIRWIDDCAVTIHGMRLSTAGSILPSPLVSIYAGHQPCAFFASLSHRRLEYEPAERLPARSAEI